MGLSESVIVVATFEDSVPEANKQPFVIESVFLLGRPRLLLPLDSSPFDLAAMCMGSKESSKVGLVCTLPSIEQSSLVKLECPYGK